MALAQQRLLTKEQEILVPFDSTKAHQTYTVAGGIRVPGVTTVIDQIGRNKGALVGWARKEALAGKDPKKVAAKAADIGTLGHFFIECHVRTAVTGITHVPDTREFPKTVIDQAENCYLGFLDWERAHQPTYLVNDNGRPMVEVQMVSAKLHYGATLDIPCIIGGKRTVIDAKSSKGIYKEHKIQTAGQAKLWMERDGFTEWPDLYCLKLGKEDGSFAFEPVKGDAAKGHLWLDLLAALILYHNKEDKTPMGAALLRRIHKEIGAVARALK